MDSKYSESVAASIVREFLARKKLINTAAAFDRELPWTKDMVCSSGALADVLHLDKIVKKYKASSLSLLEIIVKELILRSIVADPAKTIEKSSHSLLKLSSRSKREQKVYSHERTVTDSSESLSINKSDETLYCTDSSDSPNASTGSNFLNSSAKNSPKRNGAPNDSFVARDSVRTSLKKDLTASTSKMTDARKGAFSTSWKNLEHGQKMSEEFGNHYSKHRRPTAEDATDLATGSQKRFTKEFKGLAGFEDMEEFNKLSFKTEFLPRVSLTRKQKTEDVEVYDFSDSEIDNDSLQSSPQSLPLQGRYINLNEAVSLKKLLFGSALKSFSPEWCGQNFEFSTNPETPYGIIQHKGGPCGVLAAVQAQLLVELLFKSLDPLDHLQDGRLRPTKGGCQDALAKALSTILWRAGGRKRCVVAVPTGSCEIDSSLKYQPDGFTEKLYLASFSSYDSVVEFFWQRRDELESANGRSCIRLVYSAIMSRGIDAIISDMDDPQTTLIGRHSYCTQELVNLLLIGRAVSNVFDNEVKLESDSGDDLILQGIPGRCDVGLLSLFEHYNSCQVGSYYKKPSFPVWVVLSESHFSVLFGTAPGVSEQGDLGIPFDLYYYDGLGRQSEEIQLSIDPNAGILCTADENDLIPPLEHCIRTRWKGASVKWNGVEPLL